MEQFRRNCVHAVRALNRNITVSVIAILTLALGIGANTAIFSVVRTVILKPLPFIQQDRLIMVWETRPQTGERSLVLPASYFAWKTNSQIFEELAAIRQMDLVFTGSGNPVELPAESVTSNYFKMLGVKSVWGRTFLQEEDQPGKERVAVISQRFWLEHFGGDNISSGKTITLNGIQYDVIGIVPDFYSWTGRRIEIWIPLLLNEPLPAHYLSTMGRLSPGVSLSDAQLRLSSLPRESDATTDSGLNEKWGITVTSLKDQIIGNVRAPLLILLAAVCLVLLIVCANVINIMLAQVAIRKHDFAIRIALGARSRHIIIQLFTESAILASIGGLLSLAAAYFGIHLFIAFAPHDVPRLSEVSLDGSSFIFIIALSCGASVIFGLITAIYASQQKRSNSLNMQCGKVISGSSKFRINDAFIACEVMLAFILLIGAGLMLNSLNSLRTRHLGFQADNLLTMRIHLPRNNYRESLQKLTFITSLIDSIDTVPGVLSSAATSSLPNDPQNPDIPVLVEGGATEKDKRVMVTTQIINGPYFQAMQIPMKEGRSFTDAEMQKPEFKIVIDEALAKMLFPGESAIGHRLFIGDTRTQAEEIVGVAADVNKGTVAGSPFPVIYWPYIRIPFPSMAIVIRTASEDTISMAHAMSAQVHALDQNQPVSEIMTMNEILSSMISQPKFDSYLLGSFACSALTLAVMGIFGVVSYNINQRTRETGIRMALGASRANIVMTLVGHDMLIVGIGSIAGMALAFTLTRILSSVLFGIYSNGSGIFIGVFIIFTIAAASGSYFPVLKATRIDPVRALRNE
jgi:putative ABC transport system permease protein